MLHLKFLMRREEVEGNDTSQARRLMQNSTKKDKAEKYFKWFKGFANMMDTNFCYVVI